jgi:hypothetical protein
MDFTTSEVFPGKVELFAGLTVGYRYNIARSSQILLWTSILRAVAWTGYPKDYRLTASYLNARRRCIELIDGIIASIPYFLGWKGCLDGVISEESQSVCGSNSKVIGAGAFYVMWPIFVAANSDFATSKQRSFVKGRLECIAENWGINQAHRLVKVCSPSSRLLWNFLKDLQCLPLQHPSMYIMADSILLERRPTFKRES